MTVKKKSKNIHTHRVENPRNNSVHVSPFLGDNSTKGERIVTREIQVDGISRRYRLASFVVYPTVAICMRCLLAAILNSVV